MPTKIEWTDETWNPVTGCSVLSAGCTNCYAMRLAGTRLKHEAKRAGLTRMSGSRPKWTGEVRFNEAELAKPLHWRRPRRIFVCAHGDLFHENVPDEWIDRVFAVMALCPQHDFQVLTKRSARMRDYFTYDDGFGRWGFIEHFARKMADVPPSKTLACYGESNLPNVWLGVSVEDQAAADERIPDLLATPAALRFLSCEPLLGPVRLAPLESAIDQIGERWSVNPLTGRMWFGSVAQSAAMAKDCPKIDWVIAGGESGPGARPMHPDWARSLRDQCAAAGVPFFFKQWGEWAPYDRGQIDTSTLQIPGSTDEPLQRFGKKRAGRLLDGVEHDGMPG